MIQAILPIYGLLRLILGVSQLVGLTAGFFLIEWIIRYPVDLSRYVMDRDVILLIYLAVAIRAFFHVIAGIGLARLSGWVRSWLVGGWIISLVVTFGLIQTLSSQWMDEGLIKGMSELFVWPKVSIYGAMILFDVFFACPALKVNDVEGSLSRKNVAGVFFAAVLFFSLLMFMGKSVTQGFHQGYYRVDTSKMGQVKSNLERRAVDPENEIKGRVSLKEELGGSQDSPEKVIPKASKEAVELPSTRKLPYQDIMGMLGGICVVLFLAFQLQTVKKTKSTEDISFYGYMFLTIGFILGIVYGISMQWVALSFGSFLAMILSASILTMKLKNDM